MQTKGRILYVDSRRQFKAIGYALYDSVDQGNTWRWLLDIPVSPFRLFFSCISLYRRLRRKGIYKMVPSGDRFVLMCDKDLFLLDESHHLTHIGMISGSRPLYPCCHDGRFYYGEYMANPNRKSIRVLCFDLQAGSWSVAIELDGIRHIHGIFKDSYSDRLWITTGDLDHECKILYSDDGFRTLSTFLEGSQNYRAIYLHFDRDSITYGTDAPDAPNKIITVSRVDGAVLCETLVGGPVFYGANSGSDRILTTAVEPSKINTAPYMEVWVSSQGGMWELKERVKKDWLPKKLFQYGHIALPEGRGIESMLIYTPVAGKGDNTIVFRKL